ncbi:glutaredoxin-C9-like [Cornus florida]|uniref:glutaredoxin-C9-like n=1 Tax=Cornus florida TaxID=4283 RepID=UPI00289816A9|nr:glutaredoxin-C9-like [Cornus florida]
MQVAKESSIRMGGGDAVVKMEAAYERIRHLASGNAVVVFTMSGCCMCHVVKQLLFGLGVGPTVFEVDKDMAGHEIHAILYQLAGDCQQPVPAVFVGGKFLGGIETVMACHINGTLVPLLKDAGALWL